MLERFKSIVTTENQKLVITMLILVMMVFLCLVMGSWLFGYWANAIWGYHFEIGSCWQGIGVVITGLGGVAALAGSAWAKHYIDSKYNSEEGEMPRNAVSRAIDNVKLDVGKGRS